jgi:AhpD family alkylhydroperoxidase
MAVTPRLNPFAAAPAPMQKWLDFSKGILQTGLEESLMELVEIRASQINGCAACLHMHTAAARKRGESEERLYLLDAWRESPLYSDRERAALAWTEALTLVSETHAPDEEMPRERGLEIAAAFFSASRSGDMQQLRSLLAADITAFADGGGKARAATQPTVGLDNVMRVHAALASIFAQHKSRLVRYGFINGLPGFVTVEQDDTLQTTALQVENDKIVAIYVTRNPDKLRHIADHQLH